MDEVTMGLEASFEAVEAAGLPPVRPMLAGGREPGAEAFAGFLRTGSGLEVKAFTGASDAAGALAVPLEIDAQIDALLKSISPIRAIANVVKVGSAGYRKLVTSGGFESGWIPHVASGKVTLALLGKHIDAAMMTPSTGLAQVKNGDIKLLGISTDKRSEFLPDVPTFKELGYDIEGAVWRGIAVKAGTPDDVVESIQAAVDKVTASADWKKFQTEQFQDSPDWKEEEFTKRAESDLVNQLEFLKANGYAQ